MLKKCIFLGIFSLFILFSGFSNDIEFTVGGGLTLYVIPTVNPIRTETTITILNQKVKATADTVNLLFGFAMTVPVTFAYILDSGWGIGASSEVGFSFLAGPQVFLKSPPSNYRPTDFTSVYNAFLLTMNFLLKSPRIEGFSIVMEAGLILRPGAVSSYDRGSRLKYIRSSSNISYRALCYAGPNFFVGFEKKVGDHISISPGFRLSPEFTHYSTYSTYPGSTESYALINFGFEFRISWFKVFRT